MQDVKVLKFEGDWKGILGEKFKKSNKFTQQEPNKLAFAN